MTPVRWAVLRANPSLAAIPRPLIFLCRTLLSMTPLPGDSPTALPSHSSRTKPRASVDAFEAFFWLHERDILGYLWRLTGDEQAAYDLSQETFLRAWRHFDTLQHYDQPRAWLFRVASNLGINHLRGRSRRGEHTVITEDIPNSMALNGDPAFRLAENDAIRRIMLDLPPKQRAAVTLCDVYGFTSAEAAAALGLSHGSLKMSLWRGRERFRQEYQRKGGSE
jgi:RNA polymerase sigma-70 factor, ECF subfamily